MDLRQILRPESVLLSLPAGSKEEIIERLVETLPLPADGPGARREILAAVLERERVMSTGIGRGVAIPHARTDKVPGLMAAVGIAAQPIPFDSIDGKPVRIFFPIVADSRNSNDHILALSHISRVLNDRMRKTALEAARSVDDVFAALTEPLD